MLYESRRILLGFRIKLNFDPSLNRENSYVFVNLSKTPTIKDLLDTIRDRFEISQDVYITLNDCRLLNSEDNAVLVDATEVRIVPSKNERNVAASKTGQEFAALVRDDSSALKCPAQMNTKSGSSDEVSERKKQLSTPVVQPCSNGTASDSQQRNDVSRTNEISDRKCRRFYSSIAETIRYLNQNNKPVTENVPVLSNDITSSECEDRNENSNNTNGVNELASVSNGEESRRQNNASFEETSDELVADKRKRRRKRKHSKKPKLECDQDQVSRECQYVCSSVEGNEVDSLSSKSVRQHIFFDGKEDQNAEFEKHAHEYNVSANGFCSTPLVDEKVQKLANSDEKEESNAMMDVTDGRDSFEMAECGEFEHKPVVPDVASQPSAISIKQIAKPRRDTTTAAESTEVKFQSTRPKSSQPQSTPPSSSNDGFFGTLNSMSNGRSNNTRAKDIVSESANQLATLLMCKQLQTPVEYNIQFSRFNGSSRNSSNARRNSRENNQTNASRSIINQKSSANRFDNGDDATATATADDVECQVLCQYKIVGDKVLLRDSNGMWSTLSETEASSKLQSIDEPRENQTITFQMLYLGANMCPSMSDLICGKVISFQKDDGKLTLSILPAFLDNLSAKCGEEDAGLPDELVHVTDNVYQISWLAVKNPRLLM